jgi:membrane-anchored glycerophosphoryl diester phosphodiesterase (GDPDase)
MFLLVPGIMFLVAACVAVPAAVVERRGIEGAIRRSFELTRGSRWPILAAGFVVMAVTWVLSAVVQVAATIALTLVPPAQAMATALLVSQVATALFSVVPIVAIAVCYHDLRRAKEGVDTAELARVFE